MANNIINTQPIAVPLVRSESGYTKIKLLYNLVQDSDLQALGSWIRVLGSLKSTAVYQQHDISLTNSSINSLVSGTSYTLTLAFLDQFILGNSTLLQNQYTGSANLLTLTDYSVETREPVTITGHVVQISENDIGNPASSIVVNTSGYADLLEIQVQEVGSADWVTVLKAKSSETGYFSLFPGEYNLRYKSSIVFSDLETEETEWVTYPDVIISGGANVAPNPPSNLAFTAYKDEAFINSYSLKLDWDFVITGGGAKRHFNIQVLPNPNNVVDLSTLDWSNSTSSSIVTSEPTYTFDNFPYRKLFAVRVATNGWGTEGSSYIYGSVYITEDTSESTKLGYLVPSVLPYPSNTKIQVSDSYIRGYKVFDVTNPGNNVLTFEYSAATGNVLIGSPGTYADGSQVTVPFLFDAVNQRLQISGKTITDSIIAADYVMGWLGGVAPSFRTANKGSYGDNLSGIWMGYEDSNTFKLDIGDATKYIRWDGTNLEISGNVLISGGGTVGQQQKQVFIYTRAATAPTAPTTGTFASPVPAGWSLTIPMGTDPVYMTSRIFTSDGLAPQASSWLTPSIFAQDGVAGAPAKSLIISSDAQAFTFNSELIADPANQTITFTANTQNISSSITWSSVPVGLVSGTGSTKSLTVGNFGINSKALIQATAEGITDTITIVRIQDGVGGFSGVLTNESHIIAANSAGTVTGLLSEAGGNFKVYLGTQDVTSTCTFSVVAPATKNGLTMAINATTGAYSLSGTWLASAQTETFTLRATKDGVSVDKIYSIGKARTGATGDTGGTGADGTRGPGGFSRQAPEGSLSVTGNWNSTNTGSAVYLALGNLNPPVEKDVVTLWNSTGSLTRVRQGSSWVDFSVKIHGNLLVDGTVRATHVNSDILSTKSLTSYFIQTREAASTGTPRVTIGSGSGGYPLRVFSDTNTELLGFDSQGVLTLTGGLGANTIRSLSAFEPSILQQLLPAAGSGGTVQVAGAGLSGTTANNITITLPVANSNTAVVSYSLSDTMFSPSDTITNPYTAATWTVQLRRGSAGGTLVQQKTYTGTISTNREDTNLWYHSAGISVNDYIQDTTHGTADGSPLTYVLIITRTAGSYNTPTRGSIRLSVPTNGGGATNLNGLNDVSITSASNGQALVYNSATLQWENSNNISVPWGSVTSKPETATRWPTWSEVTSKPSTFTPAEHTHAWADITSGVPATATRWPTWSEVTSKPSTFAPSAHTHTSADLTGSLAGDSLGVANNVSSSGNGLSLYNGAVSGQPTYGIMFAGTPTFGTHGKVTDTGWATYLTMNASTTRGWIFKAGSGSAGNVASISGGGWLTLNGGITAPTIESAETNSATRNLSTSSLNVYPTANTDGTYTASLALRSSASANYGWGINAYRNTSSVGRLDFSFHNNSAAGSVVFTINSNGNCVASGTITGTDLIYSSDNRLKRDQKPILNAIAKLHQLTGKTYYRTDIQKYSAGVIAQDVQRILPEAVTQDENGYLAVSPSALIGLLVEAVKELSAEVKALKGVN